MAGKSVVGVDPSALMAPPWGCTDDNRPWLLLQWRGRGRRPEFVNHFLASPYSSDGGSNRRGSLPEFSGAGGGTGILRSPSTPPSTMSTQPNSPEMKSPFLDFGRGQGRDEESGLVLILLFYYKNPLSNLLFFSELLNGVVWWLETDLSWMHKWHSRIGWNRVPLFGWNRRFPHSTRMWFTRVMAGLGGIHVSFLLNPFFSFKWEISWWSFMNPHLCFLNLATSSHLCHRILKNSVRHNSMQSHTPNTYKWVIQVQWASWLLYYQMAGMCWWALDIV